jgi:hypothetical protein
MSHRVQLPVVTDPGAWDRLTRVFQAQHISTPLKTAHRVKVSDDAAAAFKVLTTFRFDQAPVVHGSVVLGWVARKDLELAPNVKSKIKRLHDCKLVSADCSVGEVLRPLAEKNLVFTVDEEGLTGFICPSDMDRHVVRSYFYLIIAAVEMSLSHLIKISVPERQLINVIDRQLTTDSVTGERLSLYDRYKAARKGNSETHAVEYLYLGQLVSELENRFADHEWFEEDLNNRLIGVTQFRHTVMHPTRSLAHQSLSGLVYISDSCRRIVSALNDVISAHEHAGMGTD